MKTITSDKLLDTAPRLEVNGTLDFGQRVLPVDSTNIITLTDDHQAQIAEDILAGLRAFGGQEQTLAMRTLGLPTAIARVDCTIDPITGQIYTYEVEERPAGMGISDRLMQEVAGHSIGRPILNHLETTFGMMPVVKRHPNALVNDDDMLLRVEQFMPTRLTANGRPVLLRAEPADMASHPKRDEATALAIAPIMEKGKRSYRLVTGMAQLITQVTMLPEGSYVLKTLQGSKAKGVKIFLAEKDSKTLGSNRDTHTRSQMQAMVASEGAVLAEPFVPGISVEVGGTMGRMILRVFALVEVDRIEVIGGAFMARPGHLVHGSKDALSGVVLASEQGAKP